MADGATWTVRRLLEWTTGYFTRKAVFQPRLSAEQLLAHVLSSPRIKLYTDYERVLGEAELGRFRDLVQRAAEDEPIAYLIGRKPFFNLEFDVTRDVLIPRPDTETLVENVLQYFRHQVDLTAPRVLDLCTGSGCIAGSIAHHHKSATVLATELSPAAAAVARQNIDRLKLSDRVDIVEGDLFQPLTRMIDLLPFDVIVSNPPYIPSGEIPRLDKSVREYEPLMALDGGADGLSFHRRILDGGLDRLKPGGRMFLEIAYDQSDAALAIAAEHPAYEQPLILRDAGGRARVLGVVKRKAEEARLKAE